MGSVKSTPNFSAIPDNGSITLSSSFSGKIGISTDSSTFSTTLEERHFSVASSGGSQTIKISGIYCLAELKSGDDNGVEGTPVTEEFTMLIPSENLHWALSTAGAKSGKCTVSYKNGIHSATLSGVYEASQVGTDSPTQQGTAGTAPPASESGNATLAWQVVGNAGGVTYSGAAKDVAVLDDIYKAGWNDAVGVIGYTSPANQASSITLPTKISGVSTKGTTTNSFTYGKGTDKFSVSIKIPSSVGSGLATVTTSFAVGHGSVTYTPTSGKATAANVPIWVAASDNVCHTYNAIGVYSAGYAAGWKAARDSVIGNGSSAGSRSNNTVTVKTPSATVDGAAASSTYTAKVANSGSTMSLSNSSTYAKLGTSHTVEGKTTYEVSDSHSIGSPSGGGTSWVRQNFNYVSWS